MPQKRILTVQAPYGGISRRQSYQTQPPFSSYDSLNFWPVDVKTGRVTSATRPGLTQFGSLATTVNMLSPVSGIRAAHPAKSFCAAYAGTIYYWNGTTMAAATGAQAASVDTGSYVSAAPLVNELVICDGTLAPIVFDYTDGTAITLVASAGVVPVAATIAASWQGALWLVIDGVLYASRVGDITDWDYSVALTDLYGAFYTDGDYKGVLAGPITSVMPQGSDVMMVSTVSGTLAMRGHPRQGGVFEPVGSSYALGQGAWCLLPDDTLLMLTPIGLMSLASSPGAVMAPVSRDKIPDELIGLSYDRDDPLVNLEYDTRWNGVHIYVRGAEEQAWWLDLNTGGFHREEIASYPYTTCEFADFITENTSGVLLGRYNGIYRYDRFSSEVVPASMVAGPIKISPNTMEASKINSARVTFARDTPTGVGSLKIAGGLDGQDAVNRLLNGEHQYETDLTSLEYNNGMCYPDVTGHAAVFAVDTTTGDVAVEEITASIQRQGHLNYDRATQNAVTGEASEFDGAYIDLDTSIWAGYSEATPQTSPTEHLDEYTHFVDLSLMPASWWAQVKGPSGEDIRVADSSDNQVPSSLVDFSLSGNTGMLVFKMTQPTNAKKVKIWVGNEEAMSASASDTYGQYNCYDDYWRGFWPDSGGISNQTQYNDNTATANKSNNVADALIPLYGGQDGPMGAKATDYNQGNNTYWLIADWVTSQDLAAQTAWTMIGAHYRDDLVGQNIRAHMRLYKNAGFNWNTSDTALSGTDAVTSTTSDDGVAETVNSSAGGTAVANWRHHASVFASDDLRTSYIDGGGAASNTGNFSETVHNLQIGCDFAGNSAKGELAMSQIHTVARSAAWIKYQADMMDQVTFWGTIGEFTLVNTAPTDTLDAVACPIGQVSQTEVGNTDGYALLTPVNPGDGSVVKFSHLIDLSLLPANWWTQAVASGKSGLDIRATDTSNTILPFDLISFDGANSKGLGVIRKNQAKGSPTAIRLWVGNATAITVDPCNAYGRYTAYDSDWYGFWPTGTGTDRTQYLNTLTAVGSPSTVSEGSPVGYDSTYYDNSASTGMYSTATNNLPTGNPITISASIKKPSGSLNTDSVIASLQDQSSRCGVFLHTRPSTTPARTTNRNAYGTEGTAGNSTTITPTTAWFQAGTSYGNHTRISYVNEAAGSSSGGVDTVIISGLDLFCVGAEYAATPVRGMDAEISLVGLHQAARGSAWVSYWDKSLDQATFWTVGAWTADPTALS